MINSQALLERFLRYVSIDTTANDKTTTYPSSAGQLALGRLLAEELTEMGIQDVEHNRLGLVLATLPATVEGDLPVLLLNAHLDTSPETSGANIQPQVIRGYRGGDVPLPGNDLVIREAENPELSRLHGCTLITTDGTTLLGADDKAGVAIIMEVAATLAKNRHIPHGPVKILFTCDEEIGRGVDHVDVLELGATVCYTLDGSDANLIDVETFSADLATVAVRGVNIHPSIAKGRMVNALRAAGAFLDRLPRQTLAPETSAGREGFLHPYTIGGGVAEVVIKILIRDFDTSCLAQHAQRLIDTAQAVEADYAGVRIEVTTAPQYRNMADGLRQEPRAVTFAQQAHQQLGRTAQLTIIRGGTDGALLTAKGLPSPNLSSGQHNPHSPLEWACLEQMVQAAEVVIELAKIWAAQRR